MCEMCVPASDREREPRDLADVPERVARGFAFLLEHGAVSGFHLDRVDLEILDMGHEDRCVLAQAYGEPYYVAVDCLPSSVTMDNADDYGYRCTVDAPFSYDNDTAEYEALTTEWRRVIGAYRAEQEPTA